MDHVRDARYVGRVAGLWRYPVKSMMGEALAEIEVAWHGLAGDRRWAFIRNDVAHSGFPWLTIRERPDMGNYRPSFADPSRPENSSTTVQTPEGNSFDITDPELGSELYPNGVHLIKQNRGIFDTFPLSLITAQTIAQLGKTVGTELEVRRFRPNILVQADDDAPFLEDNWVGRVIRIGGLRMRIDKRDGRCVIITIDPLTTARNPAILRALVGDRQGCLGVYGSTVQPGLVALNDAVLIEEVG